MVLLKKSLETVFRHMTKKDDENISKQERLMLLNVFKMDQIRSTDIMIPRADIKLLKLMILLKKY